MALTGKNLWLIKGDVDTAQVWSKSNVIDANKPKVVTTNQNVLYIINPNDGTAARTFSNVPLNLALISKVEIDVWGKNATIAKAFAHIMTIHSGGAIPTANIGNTTNGDNLKRISCAHSSSTAGTVTWTKVAQAGGTTTSMIAKNTYKTITLDGCSGKNQSSSVTIVLAGAASTNTVGKVCAVRIYYKINGVDTLVYSVM